MISFQYEDYFEVRGTCSTFRNIVWQLIFFFQSWLRNVALATQTAETAQHKSFKYANIRCWYLFFRNHRCLAGPFLFNCNSTVTTSRLRLYPPTETWAKLLSRRIPLHCHIFSQLKNKQRSGWVLSLSYIGSLRGDEGRGRFFEPG